MTLKTQFLALIAVPLIALTAIGGLKTHTDWNRLQNAQATQTATHEAVALLELVHHLQVERVLSAVHLNTDDNSTLSDLRDARTLADSAAQDVPKSASDVLSHMTRLNDYRSAVTRRDIATSQMGSGYSDMIFNVLSVITRKLLNQKDAQLGQLSASLVSLAYAKEAAGQQRAAGSTGFGREAFDQSAFRWFVRTGAIEKQLLDIAALSFETHFPKLDLREALAPTGLPDIREKVLKTSPNSPAPAYKARDWFARATQWVSALHDAETVVSDRLIAIAGVQASQAKNALITTSMVALGSLLLSSIIGVRLITTFTSQFSALQRDLDKLARKEFDFFPATLESQAEVGRLSRSMEHTRVALSEAEDRLIKLEQTRIQDRGAFVASLDEGLARLANGDLDCKIEAAFAQEYETPRLSFNDSITKLTATIQNVTSAAESINFGASEISQAADHLSKRTEGQAATLEETAAALEELTTSVKSSADGARSVKNTMSAAREEAHTSGTVVQSAVTAMNEIEQSSAKIAQIISVIDDIAFQTNLLALNAGVEAARAGDHGKGFAVVASEVRKLARNSSEAGTEIKTLISESARQVQEGVDLVGEAGTALNRIVDRVNDISRVVSEIASGTVEQATGLQEINANVHQLDDVTQKNAAMVEESTAAGHLLHSDATRLSSLMGQIQSGAQSVSSEPDRRRAS
ncbi:MAG: methyl-accepting chemotaxis protein [Shimia sp.]|uniref:methyl-accepting chemotaxis protein n=1 Tax=Shimia sp. TaxID=1954381 RepID=UPI004058F402